ncbi:MAG: hypothetical protein RLZ98_1847 [Pseudomonadota bacterium]|jgi:hypothetical protein
MSTAKSPGAGGAKAQPPERQQRLAEQLRANLMKRKAQVRRRKAAIDKDGGADEDAGRQD